MNWQPLPYVLPLLGAMVLSAGLAIYAWRRPAVLGVKPFIALMLAVFVWTAGYTVELMVTDPSLQILWAKVEYLGIVTVPVAWLAFALEYTGQDRWLTRRNVALLSIVPLLTLLLVWTNEIHGLIWRQIGQEALGPLFVLDLTYGPMFWLNFSYAYLLLLLGTALLAYMLIQMSRTYRRQAAVSILGVLMPWIGNAVYISGVSRLDLTSVFFALAGLVFVWGLFRYQLLDLVPVAQRVVITGSPNGVVVLDVKDRIVDLNPAAERILGHSTDEMIGRSFGTETWGFQTMNVDRGTGHSEIYGRESKRTYEVRTTPLHDQLGRLTGCVVTMYDITRQKEIEADLLRAMVDAEEARITAEAARQAAEAASRAKSVFLANMSHELRTPLNAVLGFSELMARDPNLTPTQRENLETISRSGEHLLALINDVLDLSKIEAGKVELQPKVFDLHDMLVGLEEMFRLRTEQKGLQMIFDIAPCVPRTVRADAGKLLQVLINLLGNAVKFVDEGGVAMRVREGVAVGGGPSGAGDAEPHTVLLHFEIEDTGVGIAPDELETLFEAFEQTESGQRSEQGTGLGLPISREYVRIMGGELAVTSQVDVGSCFSFEIPFEVVEPVVTQDGRSLRRAVKLVPGQPRPRVLVVDGAPAGRQLLVRLLQPLGFDMRQAADGSEAVQILQAWQPHLIFVDLRLPGLDAREMVGRMRALPQGEGAIFIALTSSVFEDENKLVTAAGCDGFVRKPFLAATILETLEEHLGTEFVYEVPQPSPEALPIPGRPELPAATVDVDWIAQMRQATVEGDPRWMEDLVSQVEARHPRVAEQLTDLAYNFAHDEILRLLDDLSSGAPGGDEGEG